ncbi:hypothetical protein [Bradyrhizobium sp. CCBAU 45384]|uniref:hypothetical protein n=1 Tax=Bradyrhizobium sp. CCBAU 45384 TaxID=858428 RepID=UPI002305E9CF|nr:hypothetical protein [Bradyrhizobium sp. CCBAU 45384]
MENNPDYLEKARLQNRGFILLGAGGGGIGPAVARALAGAGAELLCVDISEAEAKRPRAFWGGCVLTTPSGVHAGWGEKPRPAMRLRGKSPA